MDDKKGKKKRIRTGKVISKSGDRSILVLVSRKGIHPKYGKIITRKKKFMVHDEENKAKPGDIVSFVETRPLSKRKRWKLVNIEDKKGSLKI